MSGPLMLMGCGKMGGALLEGWLAEGMQPGEVAVVEPAESSVAAFRERGVLTATERAGLPDTFHPATVIVAVKPQVMSEVLPALRQDVSPGTVFLSIAAGRTIKSFEDVLGPEAAIVRAMPNTPAAVGRGFTVLCPNARATAEQTAVCERLMRAVGEAETVGDETLLDAVTAVSGGGPAYVFLLIECLAKAGEAAGLPGDLAMRLARSTVSGAGELAYRSPETAARLRANVTSPGGTTLEALNVLMEDEALQALMTQAIAAAAARSRELAK